MKYRPMAQSCPSMGGIPEKTVGWMWGFGFGHASGWIALGLYYWFGR